MRTWLVLLLLLPGVAAQNDTVNATAESNGPGLVLDRFDNPLPAPLDGQWGVFLLNVAFWVAIGLAVAIALNPVLKTFTRWTKTQIDDHVVRIVTVPAFVLIAVQGTVQSIRAFALPSFADRLLGIAWTVFLYLTVTVVLYRVWNEIIREQAERVASKTQSKLDDKLFPLFENLGGIVILFAGAWFTLSALGVDMTLIAAGGAVGGLVIAFAAQDTLGNLFAGVFIILDQPFREGDRIEIQELDTWGDVVDIGLRTTRIRTRDNRMVVVPNSLIGSNPVVNHSFPDTSYRIGIDVGIAYGTDVEQARAVMLEALKQVPGVMTDQRMEALFQGFGDSALNWHLRAWFPHFVDKRRYQDKMHTVVERALRDAGIEIPFPQRVIHMAQQS
ncbi:MAG: mechanosensitive ion channel family protein [Thermoplasmatota archaeon]